MHYNDKFQMYDFQYFLCTL